MSSPRIGVVGGGQLAWMMAGAARELGIDLAVQTPNPEDPAASLATEVILAEIGDVAATARLAGCCDAITWENEFVDLGALQPLAARGTCFRPSLESLAPLLDKYEQRRYLQQVGLPVPYFAPWEGREQVTSYPAVLKLRRQGYDGQGTFLLREPEALEAALRTLAGKSLMLEAYVPFERELATIAARSPLGEVSVYPPIETWQEGQVCRRAFAPADLPLEVSRQAEAMARHLLVQLNYVGVLALEMFLTPAGNLLVNEVAPRTHNSGHYTLDACTTSQFAAHLQAVAGLPLGSPNLQCSGAVMVNLLGYEFSRGNYREKRELLAAIPGAHLYWYEKKESRPSRKLGHVTVLSYTAEPLARKAELTAAAEIIESIWYPAPEGKLEFEC